jgi:hypothetical protein
MLYWASSCLCALFRNLPQDHISSQKRVISTSGFGNIITVDRLELNCKFSQFADNETFNKFEGQRNFSEFSQ